ncbi:hypothetical protein GBA52_027765 [Prunus armeniaca]|nr:hypothetical protein GBA52_027765 [Prunus armeniaca]
MAFSLQALRYRVDQKLYHLQTPQSPIRTSAYKKYCMDEYPTGTNAIIAVLSYTGYDMEDAMILNKSSVERGMFHGQIYQTETVDLSDGSGKYFRESNIERHRSIGSEGFLVLAIKPDEEYYSIYNEVNNELHAVKRKGSEAVIVDYVAIDGKKHLQNHPQKVSGQPDCNVKLLDVSLSKNNQRCFLVFWSQGGSLHGEYVDATPFANSKKANEKTQPKSETLVDELGEMLKVKGFNYYGLEVLYSGVYGTKLTCEIFIGPVYYQRLQHMVSDKFQVKNLNIPSHPPLQIKSHMKF